VPANLAGAALQELEEEMHIRATDVAQLRFLALALDLTASKPEFVLEAALKQDSTDYISRWNLDVSEERPEEAQQEEFTELQRLAALLQAATNQAGGDNDTPFGLAAFWGIREKMVPACQAALMAFWLCHQRRDIEGARSLLQSL
jgi:hypothetical protein